MTTSVLRQFTRIDIDKVDQAVEYLRKNFSSNISAEHLSIEVGLEKRKLQIAFKRRTSFSIHQFQIDLRIRNAMKDLQETDFSIKQIAAKNGFNDSSQLGKIFKKKTGVSPYRYRKQLVNTWDHV